MEASLKAAEVVVPPDVTDPSLVQPEETPAPPAACASFDPMDEFRTRLDDIVSSYSKTSSVLEQQSWVDAEMDKKKDDQDNRVTVETEMSLVMQSLSQLSSPEEKLKELVKKYAEMASLRRGDEQKMILLQQKFSRLLDERQQLQKEQRSNITARTKLESLCRDLQMQHTALREETLERCREDEAKRNEMTAHFQNMLTEIQDQIEQHNGRNEKLCRENNNLTEKLESLMGQCELREESLEKINKHRDLQQKLTEARLAQANALLIEAEEKHKREKEYLLREAIDKTKKCFTMKEEELSMKKKLTLYAQKFDEFQGTLAKSNEIFHRFKKEMDTMSEKMKKMEKESNLWKTRFENCNTALTDMLEERTEKSKEYDVFVLKIHKLEKLCRVLQSERKILYDKIKDVRRSNADLPAKLGLPPPDSSENSVTLSNDEIDIIQKEDPVLTHDMARLRDEQAKLQLFANSLFDNDDVEDDIGEIDLEDDIVASAFAHFKTKKQPEEAKLEQKPEEKDVQVETPTTEVQKVEGKMAEQEIEQECQETKLENAENGEQEAAVEVTEGKVEASPVDEAKLEPKKATVDESNVEISTIEDINVEACDTTEATAVTEPEKVCADEPKVENSEVKEVKEEAPVREENKMAEVEQKPPREEAAAKPVSENGSDSSKKQVPKKKKKRNNKNSAS